MQLHIEPHQGIGPVSLGMTREEVRRAMGQASLSKGPLTDCYFGSSFQINYRDERVDFIEVSSSIKEPVFFEQVDVFDIPADELLAVIALRDSADPLLSRPPNQYLFANLILTLWGRSTQYDHRGGRTRPVFAAVGIGTPEYLAAIKSIRG